MTIIFILSLSVLLQFVAAYLAFRLIPLTGRKLAWGLISAALLFMGLRRCVPLIRILLDDATIRPDLHAELMALAISILMVVGIALITPIFIDRKRAVDALQESKEKYRTVADFTYDWEYWLAPDGKYVYVSPSCERISGYRVEEFLEDPKLLMNITHPDDKLRLAVHIQDVLQGKSGVCTLDFRIITRAGQECWISHVCQAVYSDSGDYLGRRSSNRDITASKRAEMDIIAKDKFMESMIQSSAVATFVVDREHKVVYWNRACEDLTGIKSEDLLGAGNHWRAFYDHPRPCVADVIIDSAYNDLADLYKVYSRSVLIPDGIRAEGWYPNLGGKNRYMIFDAAPIRGENGQITAAIETLQDFTEQKLGEEALRESENLFHTIFDRASDGILIADVSTKIFFKGNAVVCSMLGYTPEELAALSIHDIHPPADLPRVLEIVEKQIKGEVVHAENLPVLRKDGTIFYADIGSTPATICGRDCLVGILRDVTERRRAHDALTKSEERFRKAFYTSPDAVHINRIEDGMCVAVNPGFTRITGYTEQEIIGKTSIELNIWHNAADRKRLIEGLRRDGQVANFEAVFRMMSGELRDGLMSATIIDLDGVPHILGITRDVTERKQVEQEKQKLQAQLLQSQKMESVGRLAGGVAHDFNNMLGVILGYVELALEKIDSAHPLGANLLKIRKAAEHSADLTRQLLAFARKQVVSPRALDMNDIVGEMLKMLQRLIGEDIRLIWQPGVNLWLVKMDPSQIDQILVNVLVNARDAVSGAGNVAIETKNVCLDAADCADHPGLFPGEYVRLTVSDDGCGIDAEMLGRIFEPYFTTKGTGKGTGLGLATVYGIVKQNEGFIDVHSEPDRGTAFRIYLPRHIGKVEQAEPTGRPEQERRGRETVLVVEDEPTLLELAKIILEDQGYRVLAASTPAEALRLAGEQAQEIHLLLTDVVLPEMNGRDLAQRFLSIHSRAKCLFASGYTDEVIARHGILDDGLNFIQKPFTVKSLLAKVRETLEKGT
ncbi:MAG: hypothetical protein C0394_02140 [Syntrophus sp. (in: bacteria)]|nr:hypothetical protein [Syntrophus sp. (in: bacteria)]